MKTLKLNSLTRNLTLIAAGAFMATLIVLPITTNASHLDDSPEPEVVPAATYTLKASDKTSAVFTLVENDGSMVLTLVEEPASITLDDDYTASSSDGDDD